jgi:predicted RND superfamily exporter protein
MSMIHLMGWEFGLIESICIIVFIGISVDYVSHLAHMYIDAPNENKKERTDYAYRHMGQTILGGALTSCFSGFFLIICNVDMLNKFGILFITTITSSFLTSLVFLPSFLYVFGPSKDKGRIKCCWGRSVRRRVENVFVK